MKKIAKQCAALLLGVALGLTPAGGAGVAAQDPPTGASQERPPGASGGGFGQQREPEIMPFDRVITKEAKSDEGVFNVHRIKDKLYYEIPKAELGKEFLWVSQIARSTQGVGYDAQVLGNRVVKWERRDKGSRALASLPCLLLSSLQKVLKENATSSQGGLKACPQQV